MMKGKKYDWKDSNLALFGSDTEKSVKKESAEAEPAWNNCGTKVGLKIWRINQFKVEEWPEEQYGEFFSGDSYIVLNTFKEDYCWIKEEDSDALQYDVHFWIGKYSSQDEYGTAAYKTVELDTFLDDKPIQHREVQGHESARFRSYFESITVLQGGCATGFRQVLPEDYKPRMLHVQTQGGRVAINEVYYDRANITENDVFIIDHGLNLYLYQGSESSGTEKFLAVQEVNRIKSTRGNSRHQVLDTEEQLEALGMPTNGEFDDGEQEDKEDGEGKKEMMKISDDAGSVKMTVVDGYGKDELKSDDVYLINTGSEVFAWIGSGASVAERRNSMSYACNYVSKTDTPMLTISVVAEGREGTAFLRAIQA